MYYFVDDFKAVVWKENGIIYCVPTHLLTEEEKLEIYKEKGY